MTLQSISIILCLWLLNASVFAIPSIELSTSTTTGGEKITLTATGGSPPYLWMTEAGSIQRLNDTQAILTTPQVAGNFSITLLDSRNTRATTQFTVSWQHFSVTPEYVYLQPGDKVTFGLHGVTGEVKTVVEAGSLEPLPKTSGVGFRYTAPEKVGFYNITFYQADNPGDTRLAHVKVFSPLEFYSSYETEPRIVFLEDYEEIFLQANHGVPPYLWIEGGKGTLTPQGSETDKMRYIPGEIIGKETITVYDSTNNSIDISVTVKGNFRMSTMRHSVCLKDNPIVKFIASGGEPPYRIEPPMQDGWQQMPTIEADILTLKFTQADTFEIVGSDNNGKVAFSSVEVDEFCDENLKLDPIGPIYELARKDSTLPPITVSVDDDTVGKVDWVCQGPCVTDDLNVTKGKIITFVPPKVGHYELIAQDQSERTGILEVHIGNSLTSLYSGSNHKLEATEMQRAIDDFFTPDFCCSKGEFYQLINKFIEK